MSQLVFNLEVKSYDLYTKYEIILLVIIVACGLGSKRQSKNIAFC